MQTLWYFLSVSFLTVENSLGVIPPVTWVENNYGVGDEEEAGLALPVKGAWTTLPDGTLQIKNLFETISGLMRRNGDRLGLSTITTFFRVSAIILIYPIIAGIWRFGVRTEELKKKNRT